MDMDLGGVNENQTIEWFGTVPKWHQPKDPFKKQETVNISVAVDKPRSSDRVKQDAHGNAANVNPNVDSVRVVRSIRAELLSASPKKFITVNQMPHVPRTACMSQCLLSSSNIQSHELKIKHFGASVLEICGSRLCGFDSFGHGCLRWTKQLPLLAGSV